jgi:hypothetical protein
MIGGECRMHWRSKKSTSYFILNTTTWFVVRSWTTLYQLHKLITVEWEEKIIMQDDSERKLLEPVRHETFSQISRKPPRPDRLWGPPSVLSNGYRVLSPGAERPRCEADHSPPFSAKVKNTNSYTSIPPQVFTAWCLVNQYIFME